MKRQTITIPGLSKDEPFAEIPAFVDGPIAVHRGYLGHGVFAHDYNVTHLPTGRWIAHWLSYRDARLFASVLLENRDVWNFDETTLPALKDKTRKAKAARKPIWERIKAARQAIGAHT